MKAVTRCTACGGSVDRHGRTLAPITRFREARPRPAAPLERVFDDDPLPRLSPVERFNLAIARRDLALERLAGGERTKA